MRIKVIIVFLCALFVAVLPLFSGGSGEIKYDYNELSNIVDNTKTTTSGVTKLSQDYVVKNVNDINTKISNLKKTFDSDPEEGKKTLSDAKLMDSYLNSLKSIIKFYDEITKQEDSVKSNLKKYKESIEKYEGTISVMNKDEHQKLDALEKELKSLNYGKTDMDQKLYDVKQKSLLQQIDYCHKRLDALETFSTNYNKIRPEIEKIDGEIDFFVETIKATRDVYQAAYDTAVLYKNLKYAYDSLKELIGLEEISRSIQQSWVDLSDIIEALEKALNDSF